MSELLARRSIVRIHSIIFLYVSIVFFYFFVSLLLIIIIKRFMFYL
jgi:hypothetical protein